MGGSKWLTMTRLAKPRGPRPARRCGGCMPGGARRTTCRSDRSISWTIRCCASRCSREHIKPRLLGHWGTTPGLNFIYVHLNRIIAEHDLNMIYVAGPGHGGPGLVANTYLEGTYSEFYPNIAQTEAGMQPAVHAVLLSGRDSQPRCAGNARVDP